MVRAGQLIRPAGIFLTWVVLTVSSAGAETPDKDIVRTAVAAGKFSTLTEALRAADLVPVLSGPGPFTVFAPTDEAFEKLPTGKLESLLKAENKKELVRILTFHVVPGRLTSAAAAGASRVPTVQGTDLLLAATPEGLMVDGAKVVTADLRASNGVIHAIDRVLLPKDVAETIAAAGRFNTLLTAAKAAGLIEALKAPDPNLTLFAPTDEAFAALPAGVLDDLLKGANRERLAALLKHHILDRPLMLTQWSPTTLEGDVVQIRSAGPIKVEGATVLLADVRATNGVVHEIDRVLVPETAGPTSAHKAMILIESAIQRGVGLFSSGKPDACAVVYESTIRALLRDHADALSGQAQTMLQKTLADVGAEAEPAKQAWMLRHALDDLYRSLRQAGQSQPRQ